MRILKTVNVNRKHFKQFIEYKGIKYKLVYDNRNGVPLGSDTRFSALVLLPNNSWKYTITREDIPYSPVSEFSDDETLIDDAFRFFTKLREHIELIY